MTPEPRETARQIAEELWDHVADITHGNYGRDIFAIRGEGWPDIIAKAIEQHVASLTADLAQARQEAEQERVLSDRMYQEMITAHEQTQAQLAAAEQARDEALAVLNNPDKWMKWCDIKVLERAESAARAALLEAAADCPWDENFAKWLRERANQEHP